jgi:hypothetical protein
VPEPGESLPRRVATLLLAAAVVVAGIGAAAYLYASQAPKREQVDRIQEDLDYLATAARDHALYAPEAWVDDLTTVPGFSTSVPAGGVSAYGHLGGRWMNVSQFDADAVTEDTGYTPQTLCELTGPGGVDRTSARGKKVKVRSVCLDVPGQEARVRVAVFPEDGDALTYLSTTLPEEGRVLTAEFYQDDPAAVDDLLDDPTSWAVELLASLTVLDPSRYTAQEIYAAEKDAGRIE